MRRRLLLIVVATTTLVVVAFAVPLGALVQSVAHDRAVTGAERDAAALAPVLALTEEPGFLTTAIQRTSTGSDDRLTVWLPDGSQLGDQTAVDADTLDLAQRRQAAFSQHDDGTLAMYTPVVTGEDNVSVIRARVPDSLLEEGVATAWLALAGVALALVVAAALVADRLARSLNRDAAALAGTARALAGGDPDVRVEPGGPPELADAASALNLLADRIDQLRSAERERVADLSHRLRTPLTALRLDAEAAGATDLVADVDALEAAVTELVEAARRPLHRGAAPPRCDLVEVVRERADFWTALAEDDERDWQLDIGAEPPVAVALGHGEVVAAVDALLANVFSHTPAGTAYAIRLDVHTNANASSGTAARLAVEDAGPGIAGPQVVQRGETSARSSGLGLDIARRTAEAAGGRLSLGRSDLGGARVVLDLPLLASPTPGLPGLPGLPGPPISR